MEDWPSAKIGSDFVEGLISALPGLADHGCSYREASGFLRRLREGSLVQFGHGKYQRRIQATITSEAKHIAVEISCDKEDTHNMLNELGLPVRPQHIVYSASEAVQAAHKIGFPVVIKPLDANHGR